MKTETIKTFRDLEVYELAHSLAMDIYLSSKDYPRDEKYSLVDQIRRSSRSVAGNIAEGWGKRRYRDLFKRHLIDSMGSLEETKSWLLFSRDCQYIGQDQYESFIAKSEELGAKLFKLHENWKDF